jgi:hypothetical protein
MKYKLICMSFDGDYIEERPFFDSIEDAWNYSNNLGSKWFFYPYHFVVTESGKTIRDSAPRLTQYRGLRTKTVANIFEITGKSDAAQNVDIETYVNILNGIDC